MSGKKLVKILTKIGYEVVRQRGSHLRPRCDTDVDRKPVSVPLHKELKTGLLRHILRDADLSVEYLNELLK